MPANPETLPEWRRGQPLTADGLNRTNAAVERLGRITVGPGLSLQDGPTGPHITLAAGATTWARVGAGDGTDHYPWTEQVRQGGAWIDGPRSGTIAGDPAVESGGNTGVPAGTIVLAWRANSNELMFQSDACG